MKASIILCTYNRAGSLAKTLRTLEVQKEIDFSEIEVLVIDNNSSDNTGSIADSFANSLPIRYAKEPRQGQSYARNRGVVEARSSFLLFTDDDVRLDPHWLRAYLDALRDFPDADFFGGRISPDWQGCRKPKWLKDERMPLVRGILLAFDFGSETRPYSASDEGPFGASFGFRRRLFEAIGPFRTDLGPRGGFGGRADDTEFLDRARAHGRHGVYVGEAHCWHQVHPQRLTLMGLYRHGVAKGQGHRILDDGPRNASLARAFNFFARGLYQLAKGRGDRFRQCIINAGIQIGSRSSYR